MGKPLIGITGPSQGSWILWYFTKMAVARSGGRVRILTPHSDDNAAEPCKGYILMGGSDIHPSRYGEISVLANPRYDEPRDMFESQVIEHALHTGKPLLGICRGMQLINVCRGGTLHQEAKDVLEDFLPHESILSKWIGRREIALDEHSQLFDILGRYHHYRVNSIHHQAVNHVGRGITVSAKEENGLIQAIEAEDRTAHPFLIGVQWHPELMMHAPSSRRLFRALIEQAKAI